METIVALDVLLKNSFDLGKANEVASNQIVEITKKLDEGLLETTKAEIRDIYDFYHIKGIFTALLLNLIVILMIGIILFMLIEYFKEVKKSRR